MDQRDDMLAGVRLPKPPIHREQTRNTTSLRHIDGGVATVMNEDQLAS